MKRFQITEVEMKRYNVLKRAIDGFIILKEVAKLIGYLSAVKTKAQ